MVGVFALFAAHAGCGGTPLTNDGPPEQPPPDGSSVQGSASDAGAVTETRSPADSGSAADRLEAGSSVTEAAIDGSVDANIFAGCPATFVPPPGPQPPAAAGASAQAQIEAKELAALDPLISAFLRGDALVYRGTVSGSSTTLVDENTPPATMDLQVPSGPALAMLTRRTASEADWYPRDPAPAGDAAFLLIHSLDSHLYDIYGQSVSDPSTTWVGTFESDDPPSTNLFNESCAGCAPVLATRPSTISIQGLVATGNVSVEQPAIGGSVPVPFTTKTSATLTLAAPCTLTWEELATLDTVDDDRFASDVGLESFQQQGDEMVAHHTGSLGAPGGGCALVTPYTIDVWVKRADLTMIGTRNVQVGTPAMVCLGNGI